MDSERFDGLVRSLGQARSRRQTLRGLAGAGTLLALLVAKPVAAGKAGKPNAPKNAGRKPGKGQPGGGQLGSPGPSPVCRDQCQEEFDGCLNPCASNPDPGARDFCVKRCATQQVDCEARCPTA